MATTIEEKLQSIIGGQAFQIAALHTQLEQAQGRIAELEAMVKEHEDKKKHPALREVNKD